MTTTTRDDLTDQLAEALWPHLRGYLPMAYNDRIASTLTPLVERLQREAAADALETAADDLEDPRHIEPRVQRTPQAFARYLRGHVRALRAQP